MKPCRPCLATIAAGTSVYDEYITFTTPLQSHLATQDLANQHMQHAQILGLGGKHFLNFSRDSLQPSLGLETEDYVSFGSGVY